MMSCRRDHVSIEDRREQFIISRRMERNQHLLICTGKPPMLATHAVGIDLGTTYSCIARLNQHGEPISIPNQDGELSTPSVVLFDSGKVIVGTEALRNAVVHPDKVVQNAKR